jgi:hypothetical protein
VENVFKIFLIEVDDNIPWLLYACDTCEMKNLS